MKKKLLSLFIAAVICLTLASQLIMPASAVTSIAEDQQKLDELEAQKKSILNQKYTLQNQIASLNGDYENNLQQKMLLEANIAVTEQEIDTVVSLIDGYTAQIKELTQRRYEQDCRLEGYYETYSKLLNYYYKYGSASTLELLLASDGISDFLTRLDYLKYIMEYNNTITDSIKLEKQEIESTRALAEEASAKLADEQTSLTSIKADLEKQQADCDALMTTINGQLQYNESQLKQFKSDADKMEQEIIALNKQITEKFTYMEGDFGWPIDSVYWGNSSVAISCGYGNRINPITNKLEFHNGIDIMAPAGTPIQAAKSGVVTRSENSSGWGNVVVVAHGDGTSTLYAHCSKLLVSTGDTVVQGQVIARVGTTGMSTGNHLHFTIYKGSSTVDPAEYLSQGFIKALDKFGLVK